MSNKKKKASYDQSQVISAIAAVKNGSSFNAAAIKYSVPLSTLRDRYYCRYNVDKHKPGPASCLSVEQEELLKDHILSMARIGYGLTKKDIPLLIQEILNKAEAEDPDNYPVENRKFKDNLPSTGWIYGFFKRHPDLASRAPENLGHQRAYVSKATIKSWFQGLTDFLRDEHKINANEFLQAINGDRIYNLDESGFPLAGTNGKLKIVTNKGVKNVYKMAPDTKEQITVLGCVSASGKFSKPFVIFPGVRPKYNLQSVNPDDYDLGSSDNGWISSDSFFGWLANLFFPSIQDKVQFPVLVFMDGHTSHINLATATFCKQNNIILYCFPPHASHVIQPLDVAIYGPLKKYWNSSLDDFAKKYKGLAMTKTHFFKVFDDAWKKSVENVQNAISGFRKSGLVPLNPEAVDYSRLVEKTVEVTSAKKANVSHAEMIGITRAFQLFESCLSKELQSLFESRYRGSYNIEDETDRSILYKFYKKCRALTEDVSNQQAAEKVQQSSEASTSASTSEHLPTGCTDASTSEQSQVSDCSEKVHLSDDVHLPDISPASPVATTITIHDYDNSMVVINIPANQEETGTPPSANLNLPSTSSGNDFHSNSGNANAACGISNVSIMDKFEYSPFKKHLIISPSLLNTKKAPKTRKKTPSAISGREYTNYATSVQEEKQRKLAEKEERKRKREEKESERTSKKRKKPVKRRLVDQSESETDEDDNQQIEFDDSSDDDLVLEDLSSCYACLSADAWDVSEAWIGCSGKNCKKWFHKSCISDDVMKMSKKELQKFDHYCKICIKKIR